MKGGHTGFLRVEIAEAQKFLFSHEVHVSLGGKGSLGGIGGHGGEGGKAILTETAPSTKKEKRESVAKEEIKEKTETREQESLFASLLEAKLIKKVGVNEVIVF